MAENEDRLSSKSMRCFYQACWDIYYGNFGTWEKEIRQTLKVRPTSETGTVSEKVDRKKSN